MEDAIRFLLGNFTLTFLVIGLIFSAVALLRAKQVTAPVAVEAVFSWFLFFSIGAAFLYNFVFHVFFGELAARFIGWADSPFQLEVGFASLGMALIGFLAFYRGFDMRLAAIVGPAAFLWGAAGGHIHEMTKGNFAPGNAGVIFWTDIFIPIIGFALLYAQWRLGRPAGAVQAHTADVRGRSG